ncbi:hypothetical protein LCGC14_2784870, partial [marine sediment metagenome]
NEPEERMSFVKKVQKQNALPLFIRDMERVKVQGEYSEIPVCDREITICDSIDSAMYNLRQLREESMIGVDIETIRTPTRPLVWCIGFAPVPEKASVIPFIKRGQLVWTAQEESYILKAISEFFLNSRSLKIFQNGGFDLSILGRYYGLRLAPNSYADTMWCFQATYPYLKKALEVLTSIYTWEPYYKDDGKYWDGRRISDEAQFIYNGRDCCVTREIWPQVERDARTVGTWKAYQTHMKVSPSLIGKMIKGVRFDEGTQKELAETFTAKADTAQTLINTETGMEINLNSAPQKVRLLYGFMGLPMQYSHKTKKPTTDKDAINRLRKKYPKDKILKAISDYQHYSKLISTYTSMKGELDGRVRTSYGWVSTFRLNSSESHFGGGGNLQNIPVRTEEGRLIRKLFIPDPGFVLLA